MPFTVCNLIQISYVQPVCFECMVYVRHCFGYWEYRREQSNRSPCRDHYILQKSFKWVQHNIFTSWGMRQASHHPSFGLKKKNTKIGECLLWIHKGKGFMSALLVLVMSLKSQKEIIFNHLWSVRADDI